MGFLTLLGTVGLGGDAQLDAGVRICFVGGGSAGNWTRDPRVSSH
jgi:hypothetical protein